ncbi:sodium-independent sulfate anion transporter-like isoform X2 [Toxorhynchites rutilus septentrionalis]|uniref:sodium-independent sulfate anion transporter-like isoform X2 n=1 Tax=Toxorhynchites rutilus septentrionalis TaxID=329112 RepID=UPI002479A689|nr:sodium-independent sulfate anion transporter-like isoform X2 [Toxorhynchites rutilus septentrionalis]XP_055632193.1 sodium-independent sulfate anion transporter-like isoform X2 [Toxorhynchites rutilus septentrionalis]
MDNCDVQTGKMYRSLSQHGDGLPSTGEDAEDDYTERIPHLGTLVSERCRNGCCSVKLLKKRVPILHWLPSYPRRYLFEDLVAGLTVGLTVIPQGIAYAVVASLAPQYGLYSAFMGCFVYFVFGSCKDVSIGPTAIMSLMVQIHVANLGPAFAILSAFLAGCTILVLGLLNLGFLVQFISMPVTAGFTTAAAITIGSGQVKSLLGLPGKSNEFLESWINVFENIQQTRPWDTVLGVGTIVILLLMMQLKNLRGRWKTTGKYVSLSRNAVVVIGGTILAYCLSTDGTAPFLLTGNVTSRLPPVQPPPFSTVVNNQTYEFLDMVSELGTSLFAIPLIAILEIIAIAKAFSKGKAVDATQEMIALGLCNIAGSFFSSMPVTGSFTRSAVNNSSGVRTTASGVVTGIVVLLALSLLTSTFYYIPKATLAAVIIAAMLFMTEFHAALEIWRTKKIDLIPFLATLIACLFVGLEYGMLVGIGINLCFTLYLTSRPQITHRIQRVNDTDLLVITPDQSLIYSSAEYLKQSVLKLSQRNLVDVVVLEGSAVAYIDSTVAKILASMVGDLRIQERAMVFWNWQRPAQNTAFRMDAELFVPLFRRADTLEEIVSDLRHDNLIQA